jgi:hypothetical protein
MRLNELNDKTKKNKKVAIQTLMEARKEALELAYQKGYIKKEDIDKGMKIPTRFNKKPVSKKKIKPIIYYGYNTITK